jgi:branched-chain amino acid transport system substrate-binding protein
MSISRRDFVAGVGAMGLASSLPRIALAQTENIKIGWLVAMTGPSSAPVSGSTTRISQPGNACPADSRTSGRLASRWSASA